MELHDLRNLDHLLEILGNILLVVNTNQAVPELVLYLYLVTIEGLLKFNKGFQLVL